MNFRYLTINRRSTEKRKLLVIGYHGNKIHLTAMYPKITSALALLAEDFNIEFWAVYDVGLGRWNIGVPKGLKVRHIQWHENVYSEEMANIDIGIVPSTMPVRGKAKISKFLFSRFSRGLCPKI